MGREQLGSLGLALAGLIAAAAFVLVPTAGATFPGGNGLIAFDAYNDATGYDIYTMKADGSARTQITSSPDYDHAPAWSPDGTKIAFTRAIASGASLGTTEVWSMNADGSGQTQLTHGGGLDPAWSPDGKKIVFDSNPEGKAQLYVMNADGAGVMRLTSNSARDFQPDWSPDGAKIAFVSDRSSNDDIWVMNADGSGTPTNLTNSAADDLNPAWTPDGAKIDFSSKPPASGTVYNIYSIPAGGGTPTQLTTSTSAYNFNPTPSPDGQKIAFDSDRPIASSRLPASATGHDIGVCSNTQPVSGCKGLGDGQNPSFQRISCPDVILSPDMLPDATAGQPYDLSLTVRGQPGFVYELRVTAGVLPPGFDLRPFPPYALTGNGTALGRFRFTITATDSDGCKGSKEYTLAVKCGVIEVLSPAWQGAHEEVEFETDVEFKANGGAPPYSWSSSGEPPGTRLEARGNAAKLHGVPAREGVYHVKITVTDSVGCAGEYEKGVYVAPHVYVYPVYEAARGAVLAVIKLITGKEEGRRRISTSAFRNDLRERRGSGPYKMLFSNKTTTRLEVPVKPRSKYCFSARVHGAPGWGKGSCITTK